jgi:hypothetical protein
MERDEYQSVHAAAVDAGIRKKMVQHIAKVEGFAKAACKYLPQMSEPSSSRSFFRMLGPERQAFWHNL